jgi:hypothetical protein
MDLQFIVNHFSLLMLILALALSATSWSGQVLCRYLLLFPVGVVGLFGFFLHAFAPVYAAERIGWQTSPFQFEVAAANLGIGIAGITAFWKNWDFSLAVTLIASFFIIGGAYSHLLEVLFAEDYRPANTGMIIYPDILIPLLLVLSLCFWKREIRNEV